MENEWKWQQENAKLQSRIKGMQKIIMEYGIPEDDDSSKRVFTKSQDEFVHAMGLNHGRTYRLARKYESGYDAIEEIMEVEGYEFNKVI